MSLRPCPRCGGTGRIEDSRMKLVDEEIVQIRALRKQGVTIKELGKRFGVHEATISRLAPTRTLTRVRTIPKEAVE